MKENEANNKAVLYGVVGLLLGVIVTWATATLAVNNDAHGIMNMMGMDADRTHQTETAGGDSGLSMDDMANQLATKTGDEFDRAFIDMMVQHHEGAIEMAELIPARAEHDEIKQLGQAIIEAQSKEINDMRSWYAAWGYGNNGGMDMMH